VQRATLPASTLAHTLVHIKKIEAPIPLATTSPLSEIENGGAVAALAVAARRRRRSLLIITRKTEGGGGESLIQDLKREANSLLRDTRQANTLGLEGV